MIALLCGCGNGTKHHEGELPANFNSIGDAARVEYMMSETTPDSVARFICNAALGKVPGAKIDTLSNATLYAYENYADSALMAFSEEFDNYSASLPLADKMKILSLAGMTDPQGLGYELGLEYSATIRDKRLTLAQVKEEIGAFKNACASDSDTYRRFIIGFQTALKVDHGKEIPEDIYKHYSGD